MSRHHDQLKLHHCSRASSSSLMTMPILWVREHLCALLPMLVASLGKSWHSLLMPQRLQSLQSSPYLHGLVLKLDLFRSSLLQSWNKTQIQILPQLASEFSSRLFNTATTASSCSSCFHFLWYQVETWDPC